MSIKYYKLTELIQAWRLLTRSFLPQPSHNLLSYTPMIHARLFCESSKFRDAHFQPLRTSLSSSSPPCHPEYYLDGHPKLDRPLFVQFCANDPNELLNAAKYVSPFCDAVDLNLGCPQAIAKKGNYGAFLQEDQELIFSLINILHRELDIPVTAKIRILETKEKTLAYAQNILNAGASILTVHARTREMKGHKTGLADWSVIKFLRQNLPKDTVIFANGNILQHKDLDECLKETGADAVMSAEGNLHSPAIFAESPKIGEEGREYWRGRDGREGWRMDAVFRRYIDIIYKYVLELSSPLPDRKPLYLPSDLAPESNSIKNQEGKRERHVDEEEILPAIKKKPKKTKREKTTNPNLVAMLPHLFRLLGPLLTRHHHVRDALAKCRAGDMAGFETVLQMVEEVIKEGLDQYAVTKGKSWEEELEKDTISKPLDQSSELAEEIGGNKAETRRVLLDGENSAATVWACKQPWWVIQPHVRPLPSEALAKGSWSLTKSKKLKCLPGKGNNDEKIIQ